MKKALVILACLSLITTGLFAATASADGPEHVARGGRLYDKWWKELGVDAPTTDHPLWSLQSTNTRSGTDTWRCKECHGWDYKGQDGAYGSGSHFTGFPGVWDAAQTMSQEELADVLKGSTNADHNFSTVLDDASIEQLAEFLKEGLIDNSLYIDYGSKAPIGGDADHGKELWDGLCFACHGSDGTQINFGSAEEPTYVGTVASHNPWEFLHKDRMGQPGAPMPSTFQLGWSIEDVVDVLAYAQTLPTGEPETMPVTGGPIAQALPMAVFGLSGLVAFGIGLALRQRDQ